MAKRRKPKRKAKAAPSRAPVEEIEPEESDDDDEPETSSEETAAPGAVDDPDEGEDDGHADDDEDRAADDSLAAASEPPAREEKKKAPSKEVPKQRPVGPSADLYQGEASATGGLKVMAVVLGLMVVAIVAAYFMG